MNRVLAGDDDPIIRLANGRIMQRLLPNATPYVYPDGHLGLITRAAELAPVVADFLRPACRLSDGQPLDGDSDGGTSG